MDLFSLPPELLLEISSYLSPCDLLALRFVSPQLRATVAPSLFRSFTYTYPAPRYAEPITDATAGFLRTYIKTATITIRDIKVDEERQTWERWNEGDRTLEERLSELLGWIKDREDAQRKLQVALQGLEELLQIVKHVKELTVTFDFDDGFEEHVIPHPDFRRRALSVLNSFLNTCTSLTHLSLVSPPFYLLDRFTALPPSLTDFTFRLMWNNSFSSDKQKIPSESATPDQVRRILWLLPSTVQSITLDPGCLPAPYRGISPKSLINTIFPSVPFPDVETLCISEIYMSISGRSSSHFLQSRFPDLRNLEWYMVHTQSPRYSLNSDVVDERVTKDGFWNSLLKLEDPRLQVEGLVVSVALPCLVEYIQHTSTPLKMLAIETIKRGMDWKPLHSAVKRHAATLNILKLPKGADEKCGIFPDRQPTSHCSRPAEASSESQDESGNPGWWPIISTMPVLRSLTVTCLVENVAHMLSVLSIHPSLSVRLKEIRICVPLTPLGWCGTFARRVRQGNQMCMEQYLKAVLAWEVPTSGRAWNEIVVVGSTDPKFYIKRAVRVATKMMREEDMDDIKEVANEDVG